MASVQVSESEKHVWKMYILLHDLDFFSRTSNFDRFQFLSQFYCERAIVPLKKALNKVYWKSFLKMKAWEVHTNFIKSTAF